MDRSAVEELLNVLGITNGERELLMLRYQDAWSCNRIASRLNISRNDVDKRLLRARKMLKDKLNATLA